MLKIFWLSWFLLGLGCTTLSPQTKNFMQKDFSQSWAYVPEVPFISQADGDCGPAALAMVAQWAGHRSTLTDIRPMVLTPEKNGSLPMDMISAGRRLGLIVVEISSLTDIAREVKEGHPVIVLQNLGFSFAPSWHYSLVVGFDREAQQMIFYSGDRKDLIMPMTYFERHWELANYWAVVVLPPGKMSASANELTYMKAASGLEAAERLTEARLAYETALAQWPSSLTALVGLGNVAYKKQQYRAAKLYLEQAKALHPKSQAVRNNLAVVNEALEVNIN